MKDKPWLTDAHGLQLLLGRCTACEHTFFPPQMYGCEACGSAADELTTLTVAARGILTAAVTVNAHPKLATPFTVGDIVLDQKSAVVQALLTIPLAAGARVAGALETVDGDEIVVFAAEKETA